MIENPYNPPSTQSLQKRSGLARIYSPLQVAGGAFVGGPIGVIYFLWSNFKSLEQDKNAQKTILFGALGLITLVFLIVVLPKVPNAPFTILYLLVARGVAEKFQMKKSEIEASPEFDFQSNWKVFGIGLVCLVASAVLLIGPLMLLDYFGFISLPE